ncbi:hypothetical protein, partial [Arenimonas malthae]|uniref:hypothetical protein n=1 Tax=Arenimonas malthae TaxID=354197 RepID=UPI001B8041B1
GEAGAIHTSVKVGICLGTNHESASGLEGGPPMIRELFLFVSLSFALSTSAQVPAAFEQANAHADAQRASKPEETARYAEAWAAFNNEQGLDERDGCYFKADGELTQILEIDSSGRVVGYYSNKDNGRSRCWKQTYIGVVFPKPPFAPYWHKLVMH